MAQTLNPLTTCPAWCTATHGIYADEVDCLHTGDELYLAAGVSARLCCSVDSRTGAGDGPHIIVGGEECSPELATLIGTSLIALAKQVEAPA